LSKALARLAADLVAIAARFTGVVTFATSSL
jgi:hypothetical protein